jgi:hypothetical protein
MISHYIKLITKVQDKTRKIGYLPKNDGSKDCFIASPFCLTGKTYKTAIKPES